MSEQDPLAVLWRMVDADAALAGHKLRGLIAAIDARIAAQVVEIIHQPRFLALEAAWRGLDHLIAGGEADPLVKVRVLHLPRRDLDDDLSEPGAFEDSALFAKLYDDALGTVDGEPYGALIGDYEFGNHPDDLRLLAELAGIGATVLAPFIAAASPQLLGLADFRGLASAKRLPAVFSTPQYAKWRALRDDGDARYLCLALPRVLARRPYGKDGTPSGAVAIEEDALRVALQHEEHCWMSAAFVVGALLARAFAREGWWAGLSDGADGGSVEALPGPAEAVIDERSASELGTLGLLPLFHAKGADRPASIGTATVHKPKAFDRRDATANVAIAARLPCLMAASRFVQVMKVMVGAKLGDLRARDCERWLNAWIAGYASADAGADPEARAHAPLVSARIEVKEQDGSLVGSAWLRPRLEHEELTAELRWVTHLP
jgi:type VI secretion system protein ImpC